MSIRKYELAHETANEQKQKQIQTKISPHIKGACSIPKESKTKVKPKNRSDTNNGSDTATRTKKHTAITRVIARN